jgi:hypothetical protein
MKITFTPNFTAMVTAHGKTRSYLHRFKIIESPVCPGTRQNEANGRIKIILFIIYLKTLSRVKTYE